MTNLHSRASVLKHPKTTKIRRQWRVTLRQRHGLEKTRFVLPGFSKRFWHFGPFGAERPLQSRPDPCSVDFRRKTPKFRFEFCCGFLVDFFLIFFPRKMARTNPPKNSPGLCSGKFPSDFCRGLFLTSARGELVRKHILAWKRVSSELRNKFREIQGATMATGGFRMILTGTQSANLFGFPPFSIITPKCKSAPSKFLCRTTQRSPLPKLHFGGCRFAFWRLKLPCGGAFLKRRDPQKGWYYFGFSSKHCVLKGKRQFFEAKHAVNCG